MTTAFLMALRNVLRNRRRTAITAFGMVLGLTVAILIRGVLSGVDDGMRDQVVASSTGAIQIHRAGYMANVLSTPLSMDFPADEALLGRVRSVPGVRAAAARLLFSGMVNLNDQSVAIAVQALDPVADAAVCPMRHELLEPGSEFGPGGGFLVARPLLDALSGKAGEEAVLIAPDQDGALNAVAANITGSLRTNGPDTRFAMVSLDVAQRLLRMQGRATEIAVALERLEDAPTVADALRARLGPSFEVHTWLDVVPEAKDNLARHDLVSSIISGVFVLLMLLGVSNTMLMSALDRTREVGTMMALGLRRRGILGLFLVEGLLLGLLGGALGVLAGGGLVAVLGGRPVVVTPSVGMPFHFSPAVSTAYLLELLIIVTCGAVLVSTYPAWRASRLRPVEALADK